MEILRLPSVQPEATIDVGDPNTEYEYTVLDLSDASVTTGMATSDNSSQVVIPLSSQFDSEYRITIDGEEHFVTVVRPYINPFLVVESFGNYRVDDCPNGLMLKN